MKRLHVHDKVNSLQQSIDYYETLLNGMRERFPDVQRHCFSPPEILNIARVSGLTVPETFRRLIAA